MSDIQTLQLLANFGGFIAAAFMAIALLYVVKWKRKVDGNFKNLRENDLHSIEEKLDKIISQNSEILFNIKEMRKEFNNK